MSEAKSGETALPRTTSTGCDDDRRRGTSREAAPGCRLRLSEVLGLFAHPGYALKRGRRSACLPVRLTDGSESGAGYAAYRSARVGGRPERPCRRLEATIA
jgi:hypothetical protein